MNRGAFATLLAIVSLAGCVHTRDVRGPSPGHPASGESAVAPYTPPPNPFARAIDESHVLDSTHGERADPVTHSNGPTTLYICPMHPEVRADRPGACPKCGMDLVPRRGAHESHGDHQHPNEEARP
jgi:hypothetical protein